MGPKEVTRYELWSPMKSMELVVATSPTFVKVYQKMD